MYQWKLLSSPVRTNKDYRMELSWAGNPCSIQALQKLISNDVSDIVFLLEIRKYASETHNLRGIGGLSNIFHVNCLGFGGIV